ncbi:glycosyltransferase family 87 protein [Cohnella xylanilytica]|uniref:glycosyltransferase family 87 protein n=1 Tax=Cohnella xylanilytica TaxID=557555 RepID=UPI001BB35E78|nr:glycosyltransferase family 87 protein [Cohnella xylanilytica]
MRGFTVYSSKRPALPDRRQPEPKSLFAKLYRHLPALLTAGFFAFGLVLLAYRTAPVLIPSSDSDSIEAPFASAPPLTLLYAWLAQLPLRQAAVVWSLGTLAAYGAAIWLAVRLAYKGKRRLPRLFIASIALLLPPFHEELRHFGPGVLTLALFLLSFYGLERNRAKAAGIPLGIALAFAPGASAILLWFFRRGKKDCVAAALLTMAAAILATAVFAGYRVYEDYFALLASVFPDNFVWNALAGSGLSPFQTRFAYCFYLLAFALVVAVLPDLRRSTGSRFDFLIGAMCALWFSPMQGSPDRLLLFIGYAIVVGIVVEKYAESAAPLRLAAGERWGAACLLLSAALLAIPAGTASDASAPVLAMASVHLLSIPILLLSRKLGKTQSRRTIPLKDYRLRKSRHGG